MTTLPVIRAARVPLSGQFGAGGSIWLHRFWDRCGWLSRLIFQAKVAVESGVPAVSAMTKQGGWIGRARIAGRAGPWRSTPGVTSGGGTPGLMPRAAAGGNGPSPGCSSRGDPLERRVWSR